MKRSIRSLVMPVAAMPSSVHGRLSERELEVAGLVASGFTNREIAEQLIVSRRTVDTHVENIRGKLGLRSRSQIGALLV